MRNAYRFGRARSSPRVRFPPVQGRSNVGLPPCARGTTDVRRSGALCALRHSVGERTLARSTMRHRHRLPQLDAARPFLTDGGLETTLIFHRGLDLPCFAAFDLLADDGGRDELRAYFAPYLALAARARRRASSSTPRRGAPTPTGRAARLLARGPRRRQPVGGGAWPRRSAPPARRRGRRSSSTASSGRAATATTPAQLMSPDEAEAYHARQVATFAASAVDMVTAVTMTNAEEAIGIARAAARSRRPRGRSRSRSRPTGACPTASRCPTPSSASTPRPAGRSPTS